MLGSSGPTQSERGRRVYVVINPHPAAADIEVDVGWLGPRAAAAARAFHAGLPGYEPTPLVDLDSLATDLDLQRLWVKDEGHRFGLHAFKGLGASYALNRFLAVQEPSSDAPITLVTATDGNHGRAVAWAARGQGHHAVVYLPSDASDARVEAIAALGADARRLPMGYDDACEKAARDAEDNGWLLLQDTAWPGYEEIPAWIMQGYLTLVDEAFEQLAGELPTHVLLQCGVGSFAASLTGWLVQRYGPERPRVILVEPEGAACGVAAMEADVDAPPTLAAEPETFMACLSCGRLSSLAWPILRAHADAFVACPDHVAKVGMRALGKPMGDDMPIVSGESGAVTVGLLAATAWPRDEQLRSQLRLGADSRVLAVSTEGATDPGVYARVVG